MGIVSLTLNVDEIEDMPCVHNMRAVSIGNDTMFTFRLGDAQAMDDLFVNKLTSLRLALKPFRSSNSSSTRCPRLNRILGHPCWPVNRREGIRPLTRSTSLFYPPFPIALDLMSEVAHHSQKVRPPGGATCVGRILAPYSPINFVSFF